MRCYFRSLSDYFFSNVTQKSIFDHTPLANNCAKRTHKCCICALNTWSTGVLLTFNYTANWLFKCGLYVCILEKISPATIWIKIHSWGTANSGNVPIILFAVLAMTSWYLLEHCDILKSPSKFIKTVCCCAHGNQLLQYSWLRENNKYWKFIIETVINQTKAILVKQQVAKMLPQSLKLSCNVAP